MFSLFFTSSLILSATYVSARVLDPNRIQSKTWGCPYRGDTVQNVAGRITAWDRNSNGGFWIRGASDGVDASSDSMHVVCADPGCAEFMPTRGVSVLVDGVVDCDFSGGRKGDSLDFTTRIIKASRISIAPAGQETKVSMEPIVLGVDRTPPTELFSPMDEREQRFFEEHKPAMYQSFSSAPLDPAQYGLDFWRSLESELVRIPKPASLGLGFPDQGVWVRGDWQVTGQNTGGGLTMAPNSDDHMDANPEAIFIGQPLDGTRLPADIMMSTELTDIVGIVTYRDGSFRILPVSAPKITYHPDLSSDLQPSTIVNGPVPGSNCEKLSVVTYNVMKLGMQAKRLQSIASEVVNYLNAPSVIFLQEIKDDNEKGASESGNILRALIQRIVQAGGPLYNYAVVEPEATGRGSADHRKAIAEAAGSVNMADSKAANIRNVILYRADQLAMVDEKPGVATASTWVRKVGGRAQLTLNPGFIEPTKRAFTYSRKALVALLRSKTTGQTIWAINVHLTSKSGSSMHSNLRPPQNKGLSWRDEQAGIVSDFVDDILKADADANIVVAGDFNEVAYSPAVFRHFEGLLKHAADVADISYEARYTFVHEANGQMLDHVLVSPALAQTQAEMTAQIIHLNTWGAWRGRSSDHDPVVVGWKTCASAVAANGQGQRKAMSKSTRSRIPRPST